MKILICGISGFIGRKLEKEFIKQQWIVNSIKKSDFILGDLEFSKKIEGNDVIINLCGAPILKRWTKKYKEIIYNSRILTTNKIVNALKLMKEKPSVFITTSAVGIYEEDYINSESDCKYANGFLATVCKDWEKAAMPANEIIRTVIFRLGVVLGKDGGAFPKMNKPFKYGIGGKLGNGKQAFPWIYIDDLVQAYFFAIKNKDISGECNLVAPQIVCNSEFTKELSKYYKFPALLFVPAFILKLIYGSASETFLKGQKVIPESLKNLKFDFKYINLEIAFVELFKR